jgi:hypothetical protein
MTVKLKDDQRKVIKVKFPSFEVFREEIMKIYPEGNLMRMYERVVTTVSTGVTCTDGSPVTYRLLMDKFSDHIRQWNMVYGSRDPRYWGKEAEGKRKTLMDFIALKYYDRVFVTSVGQTERNRYLFGNFSVDYLKKMLEKFKRRFPDEKN